MPPTSKLQNKAKVNIPKPTISKPTMRKNSTVKGNNKNTNILKHKEKVDNMNKLNSQNTEKIDCISTNNKDDTSSSEDESSSSSEDHSDNESNNEDTLVDDTATNDIIIEKTSDLKLVADISSEKSIEQTKVSQDEQEYKKLQSTENEKQVSNSQIRILPGRVNDNPVIVRSVPNTKVDNTKLYFSLRNKDYSFLSNFYVSDIVINSEKYFHVEGYYQACKFMNYNDKAAKHIQFIADPSIAKKRAYSYPISKERLEEWDKGLRNMCMMRGVLVKFLTNKELSEKLLNTGDRILIESTIDDYYWGCGKDYTGENKLGQILMKVRQIIKQLVN